MNRLIDQIRQWMQGTPPPESPESAPVLDEAAVGRLVEALCLTRDEEYDCAQVYALLDEYAEHLVSDRDAAQLMPLVAHHLCLCGDCRGEHEALLRALREEPAA
jgi:hypothetical protein